MDAPKVTSDWLCVRSVLGIIMDTQRVLVKLLATYPHYVYSREWYFRTQKMHSFRTEMTQTI